MKLNTINQLTVYLELDLIICIYYETNASVFQLVVKNVASLSKTYASPYLAFSSLLIYESRGRYYKT